MLSIQYNRGQRCEGSIARVPFLRGENIQSFASKYDFLNYILNLFSFFVHSLLCVCVLVRSCLYVMFVCAVYTETRGENEMSSSIAFHLDSLSGLFISADWLDWLARAQGLFCSFSPSAGMTGSNTMSGFCTMLRLPTLVLMLAIVWAVSSALLTSRRLLYYLQILVYVLWQFIN